MGPIGQGVKTLNGVDYSDGYSFTLSVVGVEVCATFSAVYRPRGSRTSRNTAERSVPGALERKPEVVVYFGLLSILTQVGVAESEKRVAAIFLLPVWPLEPPETLLSAVFRLVRLPRGR